MESQLTMWLPAISAFVAVILGGVVVGAIIAPIIDKIRLAKAERDSKQILEDANKEAEHTVKEAKLIAKDEVVKARSDFEKSIENQRNTIHAASERLELREQNLDRKLLMLDKKEEKVDKALEYLDQKKSANNQRKLELEGIIIEQSEKLQEISKMTEEEAGNILMKKVEETLRDESAARLRKIEEETKRTASEKAREIITTAIQRYTTPQLSEITTCTVHLPNDDMKGRIIGKDGRNIRAFQSATGVDIMIDDTPEIVVLSGFDPLRREIAKIALERLVSDGRIQPSRIEETVNTVTEEIDATVRKAGEEALQELGVQGIDPKIVNTLGRLKFRSSYAQNVLQHSIEVAHIMSMLASDLGLDIDIAKRVGLFHDLGKAIDHRIEGSHAVIGADLLRKFGTDPVIINAVAAHHNDVDPESIYATLAFTADAISASRPGARSESSELYLKRLKKLEEIANGFRGVEKSYAIQAGREIRVIVEPSHIDDNQALQMAHNISRQIEEQLEYPGQIKVTVIRETRCVEYAS